MERKNNEEQIKDLLIEKRYGLKKFTPFGAFVSTLYRNSEKEKLKDIRGKIKKIKNKPNDIVMIHSDEIGLKPAKTEELFKKTLQDAFTSLKTEKSKTGKDGFRWIQFDGGHFFGLCIHQNKIILFDTLGMNTMTAIIKRILNDEDIKKELGIADFKFINLNQQTDLISCPTFTGYNIKKLKKAFLENPALFNELFDDNEIDRSGTVINKETLYKKLDIIPSIQRQYLFNKLNGYDIMKQMFENKKKCVNIGNQGKSINDFSIKTKEGNVIVEQNCYSFNNDYIPLKQGEYIELLTENAEYLLNELNIYEYLGLNLDGILKEVQKPVYRLGNFN